MDFKELIIGTKITAGLVMDMKRETTVNGMHLAPKLSMAPIMKSLHWNHGMHTHKLESGLGQEAVKANLRSLEISPHQGSNILLAREYSI